MILHIFRTKVMNRGLNSKRLLKKIKKMGKGLPRSLPEKAYPRPLPEGKGGMM